MWVCPPWRVWMFIESADVVTWFHKWINALSHPNRGCEDRECKEQKRQNTCILGTYRLSFDHDFAFHHTIFKPAWVCICRFFTARRLSCLSVHLSLCVMFIITMSHCSTNSIIGSNKIIVSHSDCLLHVVGWGLWSLPAVSCFCAAFNSNLCWELHMLSTDQAADTNLKVTQREQPLVTFFWTSASAWLLLGNRKQRSWFTWAPKVLYLFVVKTESNAYILHLHVIRKEEEDKYNLKRKKNIRIEDKEGLQWTINNQRSRHKDKTRRMLAAS